MNVNELAQIKLAGVASVLHGLTKGKLTIHEAMPHLLEAIRDIDDVNDMLKIQNTGEGEPPMSAGPLDKLQVDTYCYRIDLTNGQSMLVTEGSGPVKRGEEWFYVFQLHADDRRRSDWRSDVTVNARHVIAVYDQVS